MHPQPIRHHYIPQFILRNFCFEDGHLYYFDKQTGCISVKDTRDVFMARNLYRDEINDAADPVKIEKDLAEYEREVAQIIRERFLNEREFFLTFEENEKLKSDSKNLNDELSKTKKLNFTLARSLDTSKNAASVEDTLHSMFN